MNTPIRTLFALLVFCLVARSAQATQPDPRIAQVKAWVRSGIIVDETEDGRIADVFVGRKFVLLPMREQTRIAQAIGKIAYDTGKEISTVSIHFRSSDETFDLGCVGFDEIDGHPTATWETWYEQVVLQRDYARLR